MANKWGLTMIKEVKLRGYVEVDGVFYPPNSPQVELFNKKQAMLSKRKNMRLQGLKTGWIDDERNIKNKANQKDPFMLLIKQELGLEVWPEFYFSTERLYRFDYCIPVDQDGKELKLAVEVQGGIWAKGNSGHSSGTGIARDMDKSNLAQSLGWNLIKITPDQLLTTSTLKLLKAFL